MIYKISKIFAAGDLR